MEGDWRRVEALLRAHEFTLRANEFPEETGRLVHKGTNFEFYSYRKMLTEISSLAVAGQIGHFPMTAGIKQAASKDFLYQS